MCQISGKVFSLYSLTFGVFKLLYICLFCFENNFELYILYINP